MDLYSGSLKLLANVHIYGEISHALGKYWDHGWDLLVLNTMLL